MVLLESVPLVRCALRVSHPRAHQVAAGGGGLIYGRVFAFLFAQAAAEYIDILPIHAPSINLSTSSLPSMPGVAGVAAACPKRTRTKEPVQRSTPNTARAHACADMRRFTKLEGLAMGYNLLTTCPAIFTLRHLRRLDLNDNQLRTIPSALSSLTALEHLNLANNHLVALPRLLAPLSQLRTLSVHGNAALQGAPRLV
jgi:hypothetical protein